MATKELSRAEIEDIVINNATRHPEYRKMLVSDPRGTVEMQLNNELPAGFTIEVLEESPEKVFVRLPHSLNEGGELSDDDLEQIAGGKGGDHYPCNERAAGFNTRNEYNVGL